MARSVVLIAQKIDQNSKVLKRLGSEASKSGTLVEDMLIIYQRIILLMSVEEIRASMIAYRPTAEVICNFDVGANKPRLKKEVCFGSRP